MMVEIFSSGGGTQSAAITAMIAQGRLPKPDFAVIVDTERERSAVWAYHDAIIRPALASVGVDIYRVKKSEYAKSDLWSTTGATLQIPAFTNQTGEPGKMPSFCSNEWKLRVFQRFCREMGVETRHQRRWIGFSLDETRRAVKMMGGEDYAAGLIRFPLIHDIPMRRHQAIALVKKMGWPTPPRSACWMCPNQTDTEWRDLKANYPADFALAVGLEKEVQKTDPFAWLHQACVPLDQIDFDAPEDLFDRACNSGGCFT